MIRKETEKRILQEICINKILSEIEELGFKYLKSKSQFLNKGKDVDVLLQIYNLSSPFELNSDEELQFKFVIRSSIQLTKFNKWHKKQYKKDSVGLSNTLSTSYTFICPISFDSFSSQDFFEPSKARMFKLRILESFKSGSSENKYHPIENLRKIISEEILPSIKKVDNLNEIISMENIPQILKIDILYFRGEKETAKKKYLDFYSTIKNQISKEDKPHILGHYSRILKDLSDKFETLFNEEIDDKNNRTIVQINKENTKQITIGDSQYQLIANLSNIFPPINLNSGLADNSNRGLRVGNKGFTIFHRENVSSEWDLELNKSGEKDYQFKGIDIPSQISELIPPHTYDSATSQTKDGKLFFVGGYNTKSFLIDVEKQTKQVLWVHEAFKKGYKDYYKVSHNFGVNQASFIQNDKYLIACACHAKNTIWELSTRNRKELELPFEYTFEGAPPSTEFANDVKQIEPFKKTNHLALVIRKNALIFDNQFSIRGEIENVRLIKVSANEEVIGIITNKNNVEIYKKNTIGNKG